MIRHAPREIPAPGVNSKTHKALVTPALCPPTDASFEVLNIDRQHLCDPETEVHEDLFADFIDILQTDIQNDPNFMMVGPLMNIVALFRGKTQTYPLPFDQIKLTWDSFMSEWKNNFDETTQADVMAKWHSIFEVIQVALVPAWIVPPITKHNDVDHREAAWHWLQTTNGDLDEIPALQPRVPQPCRQRYAVHIFSGRRRQGDLQQALEALPSPDGVILHVLSLDVVFGADGDLLSKKARGKWLSIFSQGAVLAFFAGPPCESWSAARFVELQNCRTRPVRSSDLPWGLDAVSLREIAQIATANALMFFVLTLMCVQAGLGLFGCMEHPGPPRELYKPTIWRTWIWLYLMKLGFSCELVRQGFFGAQSSKPTIFAFTQPIPTAAQIFRDHHIREDLPQYTTIGRNSDGSFATSALKEYPRALCKALSMIYLKWSTSLPAPTSCIAPEFRQFLDSFETAMGIDMGPDYNPPKTKLIQFA